MLAREHSDFAWFKARTDSLNFDLTAGQSEMANADERGLLNAETSQPSERAEHDLPPKSYAEAIFEPFESQQEANKHAVETNGHSSTKSSTTGIANGLHPTNGAEKQLDTGELIRADPTNGKGIAVASVKPDPKYAAALQHDQASAPRQRRKETALKKNSSLEKSTFTSGRSAGAGWSKSAYVCLSGWMMRR